MDESKLIAGIEIVLEKDLDNAKKGSNNYILKTNESNQFLDYPLSDTLIDIFSNVQNKIELKEKFITTLARHIEQDRDNHYLFKLPNGKILYLGISSAGICFYTLLRLGFAERVINSFKKRIQSSDNILRILGEIIKESNSYLDISSLSELKKTITRISKTFEEVDYKTGVLEQFKEREEGIKSTLINLSYECLKKEIKGINIEINQDKKTVSEKIAYLQFDNKYNNYLSEIDRYINTETSAVINSGIINTLRVFIQDLFRDIAKRISTINKEEIPKVEGCGEMGNIRYYLNRQLDLSENDSKFINSFINILHGEGGHSFTSNKEYFRLARNIAIEIALLVLSKYEKVYPATSFS